jgi:hypothetical protein
VVNWCKRVDKLVEGQTSQARNARRFGGFIVVTVMLLLALRFWLGMLSALAIDSVRMEGYPTNFQELVAYYPPKPGPNGADLYRQACEAAVDYFELLKATPFGNSELKMPLPHEPFEPEVLAALEQYVALNAPMLELVRQASERPYVDFGWRTSASQSEQWAWLVVAGRTSHPLRLAAIVAAEHGRADEAARLIEQMLTMARRGEDDPSGHVVFGSFRLSGDAVWTLERVLARVALSDDQLAGVASGLDESHWGAKVHRAVVGFRARFWSYSTDQEPLPDNEFLRESLAMHQTLRALGIAGLFEHDFLNHTRRELRRAHSLPDSVRGETEQRPTSMFFEAFILTSGFPDASSELSLVAIARSRLARVAVACHAFARRTGRFPRDLAELVPDYLPAVPLDMYDGQPLRYRLTEDGARVYSIGSDGDQGGRTDLERSSGVEPFDHVFQLALPPGR